MAKLKPEFVAGCRTSNTSEQVIEFLWATNEKSADYSFSYRADRVNGADAEIASVAGPDYFGIFEQIGDIDAKQHTSTEILRAQEAHNPLMAE